MKKMLLTTLLAFTSAFIYAQVIFMPKTNHEQEKAYGPPEQKTVTNTKTGDSAVLQVEVMLKKPIVMGCQYIYRITNLSKDKTVKITSEKYAGQFQMKKEKLKPGEAIEFLVNTMSRCDGKTAYEKCIDCQDSLTLTNVDII